MRLSASEKLEIIYLASSRICRPGGPWRCSASNHRRFIVGMTGSDPAGQKLSKISRRSLTGSGTVFPTTYANASSRGRLISQNSARASRLAAEGSLTTAQQSRTYGGTFGRRRCR